MAWRQGHYESLQNLVEDAREIALGFHPAGRGFVEAWIVVFLPMITDATEQSADEAGVRIAEARKRAD